MDGTKQLKSSAVPSFSDNVENNERPITPRSPRRAPLTDLSNRTPQARPQTQDDNSFTLPSPSVSLNNIISSTPILKRKASHSTVTNGPSPKKMKPVSVDSPSLSFGSSLPVSVDSPSLSFSSSLPATITNPKKRIANEHEEGPPAQKSKMDVLADLCSVMPMIDTSNNHDSEKTESMGMLCFVRPDQVEHTCRCQCGRVMGNHDDLVMEVLDKLDNSNIKYDVERVFNIFKSDACFARKKIDCLEMKLQQLRNTYLQLQKKSHERYAILKRVQRNTQRSLDRLKEQYLISHANLAVRFRKDQLAGLLSNSTRGREWSLGTVREGLIHRMKMGTRAYSDFVKEYPMFPSVRVLQRKVQHCKFKSGILHEVFDIIEAQVQDWPEEYRECHLSLDEMAIEEGCVYDTGLQQTVGKCTLATHSGNAKKVLVFMLAGSSLRWKFPVAYFFTNKAEPALREEDQQCTGREMRRICDEIIAKGEGIKLRINCVITDMGADNQAMWKEYGVGADEGWVNVIAEHPVRKGDPLIIMPDTVHVLKNIPTCLASNKKIELDATFVEENGLTTNQVTINQFEDLIQLQSKHELVPAFRLRDEVLTTKNNFMKMRVSTAKAVICKDTEVAFMMMAREKKDDTYYTPARFIGTVSRWFDLMTNRGSKLALRLNNMEAYEAARADLMKAHDLFKKMKIGSGRKSKKTGKTGKVGWKPCQTGVVMSTIAILLLAKLFLTTKNYKFFLAGRFTQDCLENFFSLIRYKLATPNAFQFRLNLKVITLTHLCMWIKESSYENDLTAEDEAALKKNFLLFSQKLAAAREDEETLLAAIEAEELDMPEVTEEHLQLIPQFEWPIVYHICGSVVRSIKKMNIKTCRCCLDAILWNGTSIHPYGQFTHMKQYTEKNPLIQVSDAVFMALLKAEVMFRQTRMSLQFVEHNAVIPLMAARMEYVWKDSNIPQCHNLTSRIMSRYFSKRWKQYWQKVKKALGIDTDVGSKTAFMHAVSKI